MAEVGGQRSDVSEPARFVRCQLNISNFGFSALAEIGGQRFTNSKSAIRIRLECWES